jgi:hypothetical protein
MNLQGHRQKLRIKHLRSLRTLRAGIDPCSHSTEIFKVIEYQRTEDTESLTTEKRTDLPNY